MFINSYSKSRVKSPKWQSKPLLFSIVSLFLILGIQTSWEFEVTRTNADTPEADSGESQALVDPAQPQQAEFAAGYNMRGKVRYL